MEDELPLLCSAFLVEQLAIDYLNFSITSGQNTRYSWKIHRSLLCRQSGEKNLLRDQNGAARKSASLSSDNPWMVARLIQFLYTRTYDVRYLEPCGVGSATGCTLENVLNGRKRATDSGFNEDKAKDQKRSELEIHLMMCEIAIKHEMPALIDHALHRAFHYSQDDGATQDVLIKAQVMIGIPRIIKEDRLRRLFAGYIADNRNKIPEATLRVWLKSDATFAIEMVDYLIEKNRGLEQQAALAKSPLNLKRRASSFEPTSDFDAQIEGFEMVTTPILTSRTIIEERRSTTEG